MNCKTIIKSIPVAFVLLIVVSCDGFLDDNINPNLTTENPPSLILSSAEGALGFGMGSNFRLYSALWAQQIAAQNGRQTENYDRYVLLSSDVNGDFRGGWYAGILADVEEILKKPAETTHPHYFGISKVMKAFSFGILVDFWGDIPFSQALQGLSNIQPEVDNDEDIYPALITMLDEAIAHFKTQGISPNLLAVGTDDYFYGGTSNISKWIKLANTIKLRLYLHMANVPGFDVSIISNFLNATPASEFMESNADNFQLRFAAISGRTNPTHQFIITRTDDICTSSTIIDLMNAKGDPRRSVYFTPSPFSAALYANPPMGTSGYKGLKNGFGNNSVDNSLSRLHTFVRGAVTTTSIPAGPNLSVSALAYSGAAPVKMLTYAEYNFIRAELALRYGAPISPKASVEEWYQEGMRASIVDAGLTVAQADAYIASDADNDTFTNGTLHGTDEEKLKQIIEEKYVANFLVAGEPWSDWRRTGYPLLQLLPSTLNPGNNGKVPRALPYPQQEIDANPKMAQRPNLSAGKVFWDTRTAGQE